MSEYRNKIDFEIRCFGYL